MNKIDLKALRKAAEAATPGPWVLFDMDQAEAHKDDPLNGPGKGWYWVWQAEKLPYYGGVLDTEQHAGWCTGKPQICCAGGGVGEVRTNDSDGGIQEQADATFIAAVSPDVVLALINEIERLGGCPVIDR